MNSRIKRICFFVTILFLAVVFVLPVHAQSVPTTTATGTPPVTTTVPPGNVGQSILDSLDFIGRIIGFPDIDFPTLIGRLIRIALSFIGIILVLLIIYSGLLWMTSGGDEEKITKAKKTIINAVIGLIIILSANTIIRFVLSVLGVQ